MSREKCKKDECNDESVEQHADNIEGAGRAIVEFTFVDSLFFKFSGKGLLAKAFTDLIRCQFASSKNDGNTCTRMSATGELLVIAFIIITLV